MRTERWRFAVIVRGRRRAGFGSSSGGTGTASALPRFRTIAGPASATVFRFPGGGL